jgi:putative sterol carrier protein
MSTRTAEFFDGLGERGYEPMLQKAKGVLRFEIVDDEQPERWTVAIDKGHLDVSHRNVACDCTLRAPKAVFEQITRGEANATAAMLRGAVEIDGDWRLLVLAERLFKGGGGWSD